MFRRAENSEFSQEISENSQEHDATHKADDDIPASKKKGPASAPTLPSHGSTSPKGNPNMQRNTTAAADAAILSAMRNLEGPIHGLSMMAEILGDMLDDDLFESDMTTGDKRCSPASGRNLKVILTKGQIDRISFAWNDVIIRAVGLQRAYLAALEGKEVSA